MENLKLTICSVCHSEENRKLLELNHALASKLNPQKNWVWMVADNTPAGKLAEIMDPQKFKVVPGLTMEKLVSSLNPVFLNMKAGFHHSTAVHGMIPYVKTRFFLLLDSDLYIVRPGWINEVLGHMEKEGLAAFDVPWHPRWYKKPRYLPATHSIFVDSLKLKLSELNFFPQLPSPRPAGRLKSLPLPAGLKNIFLGRTQIGVSRDMGFIIGEKLLNEGLKYECAIPVFRPEASLLNFLLPDRFSYAPKRRGSYTKTSFGDLGYPDYAFASGAEEFMWQGRPFCFHLRGHKTNLGRGGASFDNQINELRLVLSKFLERNLGAGAKL